LPLFIWILGGKKAAMLWGCLGKQLDIVTKIHHTVLLGLQQIVLSSRNVWIYIWKTPLFIWIVQIKSGKGPKAPKNAP